MTAPDNASPPLPASSTRPPKIKGVWARWRWPVLAVLAWAGLWTVLVGMWLPGWVRPRVEAAATEALGTPVTLQAIDIKPWTGVLSLQGLRVGPAAAPMLAVHQAQAQLSLESIWRLAPVLRRVEVVKPELWVERLSESRFNFSAVIDKLMAPVPAPQPKSAPARFAIFNVALQDGVVHYTDRVLNQSHVVDQLRIGVPFISNLPSFIQVEVKPALSARLDGSPLRIEGDTLPFTQGLRSAVRLKWTQVEVPHWLAAAQAFLPPAWQMAASDGKLDADLTLKFEERQPPALPLLSIEGALKVDKLALKLPHAPWMGMVDAGWQSLSLRGLQVQPLAREAQVAELALDGLAWRNRLLPAPRAVLKLEPEPAASASALAATGGGKPEDAPTAAQVPWSWRVGKLALSASRLDAQTEAAQPWPAIEQVRLNVTGLSSQAQAEPAAWQLDLRDEHGASLQAHGHAHLARHMADVSLNLAQAAIKPWLAPLAPTLDLPLQIEQGNLGLQATLDARWQAASALEPAQAHLTAGRLTLAQVDARAAGKGLSDRIQLDALSLDGIEALLDLSGQPGLRSLSMNQLDVNQLNAAITRGPRGEFLGMHDAADAARTQPDKARPDAQAPVSPNPLIKLATLQCRDCQLQFKDQTVKPAAQFALHQTNLILSELGSELSHPIGLDLDTLAQGKGRVKIKGAVQPQPLALQAQLKLAGLDLRALQPYIDPLVNITLAGAKAQADGQLELKVDPKRPASKALQARYKGRLGLSEVRVLDRVNDADFLSWKALTLDGTELSLAGDAVDANLGRIALTDFYGRVIITPNGKLNLAGIMRHEAGAEARSLTTPEGAAASAAPASAASTQPAAPTSNKPTPKLRWQQIQLSKGRVDFTDNFIKPNYSARLTRIEGDVSAVSSVKPEPATVKVSGTVDDAAPLLITGQLHPLGPQLYTDIQGSAKGIELTRLTPYAARYAGYAIEKGTLSVTVHYKVDGGKLEASNQIFLDQLTFGEKTDSPDATTLPVQFAVSLLKNSKGEIDVDLPISGSLDDPQFSVGGIIWRVIVNLITKAVTAPFALLSGGGNEELGYVPFEPGQARLNDKARQSLDVLATKLADRPALKLEATGRADPAVDTEGLRQAHVDALMRAAKAKATGQPLSDTKVDADERATWLSAAYKAADIKKPRNVIGLAKTLPDEEMEALLKASAPVSPEALRLLANQRGDQVKAYLSHKLSPERVLLTASKLGTEGLAQDKGPSTRVQFEVK